MMMITMNSNKGILALFSLLLCFLMGPQVFANLGDLDVETERFVNIIASDTGEAQNYGGTVYLPVSRVNGGVAVSYQQQRYDGDILSDIFEYRFQGGPVYRGVGLQFFVEGEWGMHMDRGFFVRPGTIQVQGWDISGGVGTFQRGLNEVLRRDSDAATVIKPLGFLSANTSIGNGDFGILTTWSPTWDLEVHDLLIEPRVRVHYGDYSYTFTGRFGEHHGKSVRTYIGQVGIKF